MTTNTSGRLMSLDTLRGFDMLFIMGFSTLVVNICALFPGGDACWLSRTMHHVAWNGLSHHDTIFPLFLFIAGISWPFSYAKQCEAGKSKKDIYKKIFRRALMLVFLGMVYNGLFQLKWIDVSDGFRFDFSQLRFASVLGRIGVAWMLASILFINFKPVTLAVISGLVLVGYWLLLAFVPAPDVVNADALSMDGNIVGYVDRLLLPGKLVSNHGQFDPEGILSTFPAVVTALLGMFTGAFVRSASPEMTGGRKTVYMFIAALLMLGLGLLWSIVFPINKMLWTSSFVLVVGAYSLAMFALFYYIIDVRKHTRWTLFFRVIGLNSITIYLLQMIIPMGKAGEFFLGGVQSLLPEAWGNVVYCIGYVAVSWLILYFLYKHKVFLKI